MRAPDVVGEPAELLDVLDRLAAVELLAVLLLLDGLREMGVQAKSSRRASSADSCISPRVTENGEHGATAISTAAPSASPAAASVAASTSSRRSTIVSGGRPPSDSPRSIDPREATMRTPSSRAARISASSNPPPPGGKR